MKNRKKTTGILLLAGICLWAGGCKKEEQKQEISSVYDVNKCFTRDGMLYEDPSDPKAGYFDYETKEYFPLCSRPNCLHDSPSCEAIYLNRVALIGQIQDRWYYLKSDGDFKTTFYSSNLDGEDERELGDFSHMFMFSDNLALFYENSCIMATYDPEFEVDDEGIGDWKRTTTGIYRYHFDTGETELLGSEHVWKAEEPDRMYALYGIYQNQLICRGWNGSENVLQVIDLETKEISEPLGGLRLHTAYVGENLVACNVMDEGTWKILELDLDTGEQKEITETSFAVSLFWTPELKIFEIGDNSAAKQYRFQMYHYTEEKGCKLIREGGNGHYFMPEALKGDMVVGQAGDGWLPSWMGKEDFLAGKDNWTELSW